MKESILDGMLAWARRILHRVVTHQRRVELVVLDEDAVWPVLRGYPYSRIA
jgi:hypothetical protein